MTLAPIDYSSISFASSTCLILFPFSSFASWCGLTALTATGHGVRKILHWNMTDMQILCGVRVSQENRFVAESTRPKEISAKVLFFFFLPVFARILSCYLSSSFPYSHCRSLSRPRFPFLLSHPHFPMLTFTFSLPHTYFLIRPSVFLIFFPIHLFSNALRVLEDFVLGDPLHGHTFAFIFNNTVNVHRSNDNAAAYVDIISSSYHACPHHICLHNPCSQLAFAASCIQTLTNIRDFSSAFFPFD